MKISNRCQDPLKENMAIRRKEGREIQLLMYRTNYNKGGHPLEAAPVKIQV